ncbi:MAG: hypothetical protein Q8P06_00100 [Candidatus Azambacteria bacterium]|nr:hypothetical protein [Candidatus Azambacteria bacterium]
MKEIIVAFLVFAIFYSAGTIVYYSGYPQTGEGVAILSCIGLVLWGIGFAGAHSSPG